ncbi:hypothetical protein P9X10_01435 [Bacillus cereus]|nr:hypothetical protein [Bacillus cereus]
MNKVLEENGIEPNKNYSTEGKLIKLRVYPAKTLFFLYLQEKKDGTLIGLSANKKVKKVDIDKVRKMEIVPYKLVDRILKVK